MHFCVIDHVSVRLLQEQHPIKLQNFEFYSLISSQLTAFLSPSHPHTLTLTRSHPHTGVSGGQQEDCLWFDLFSRSRGGHGLLCYTHERCGGEGCEGVWREDVGRKDDERKFVSATMLDHVVLTLLFSLSPTLFVSILSSSPSLPSPLLPPSTLPPQTMRRWSLTIFSSTATMMLWKCSQRRRRKHCSSMAQKW